jgi:putative peptidoglycan lipid II flippase
MRNAVPLANACRVVVGRWHQISTGSVNRRIFRAIVLVGGITGSVAAATLLRDVIVARAFGTSDVMDAFLIAFLLPTFSTTVVAGSFNSAFIPTYIQVRHEEGEAAAQRLCAGVTLISMSLLLLVTLILALVGPYFLPLLGSRFGPAKLAVTHALFYILLPTIFFQGLSTIWGAVLNAREQFALPSVVSVLVPVTAIGLLVVLGHRWGIYALAVGTAAGYALQWLVLAWGAVRSGLSLWPRWDGPSPALRQVVGQFIPMTAGAALMSSTVLVDQSMAAVLHAGSVSALSYGNKAVALITGLAATALGTAVTPYLSGMTVRHEWRHLRHTLRRYLQLIASLGVPLMLSLIVVSQPLIQFVFERGAFTPADTLLVARVQALYALQIPFYVAGILGVRLMSALLMNDAIFRIAGFNLVMDVVLNLVLSHYLGVAGIALSTSLVYVMSCVLVYVSVWKKHGRDLASSRR